MAIVKGKRSLPGVRLAHRKNTQGFQTQAMPVPDTVKIPMCQHMGAVCQPLVKPGDTVYVGQKIGEVDHPRCVPIHSSVSGTVTALEDYTTYSGVVCKAVVIQTDQQQTPDPSVAPPVLTDKASFIRAVYESGMVGLGGAGFPTHLKLNFQEDLHVDALIINGAECEPYITADHREFLEHPEDIVEGIQKVLHYLGIAKAYIGIETNKPDAIRLMQERTASLPDIQIIPLCSVYPQGAEKVLIYAATGRVIEAGTIPVQAGVIVMNFCTVSHLNRYFRTGMPLISRRVTVDGDCIGQPKNAEVLIGSSIQDVVDFCGGFRQEPKKVLMGGPMMGVAVYDLHTPIIKNNNAILCFSEEAARIPQETACIRCGKCSQVCPVGIMPRALEKAYDAQNLDELERLQVNLCLNCGCCSYICPAKRNLAQKNQLAKMLLRANTKR